MITKDIRIKQYTVFYQGYGSKYKMPVLVSNGKYYLGGGRCYWILTTTKVEAENIAREVRKQREPSNFDDGRIFVEQAELRPWSDK